MNKAFSEFVAANNAAPNTLTDAQLSATLKMRAAVNNASALAEALEALVDNVEVCSDCNGKGTMRRTDDACETCGGIGEVLASRGLLIAEIIPAARAALAAYRGAK